MFILEVLVLCRIYFLFEGNVNDSFGSISICLYDSFFRRDIVVDEDDVIYYNIDFYMEKEFEI